MNVVKLISQRYSLSKKIENKINNIWNKYAKTKFNIYFHGNYKGGYISIFKNAKNTERTIYKVKDKNSNCSVEIEIDKEVEKLYPKILNNVIKEITGKSFNEIKNNNF